MVIPELQVVIVYGSAYPYHFFQEKEIIKDSVIDIEISV